MLHCSRVITHCKTPSHTSTRSASSPVSNPLLGCKICHKEFPKFDQRGFRNPGFTAHQNRCIRRYLFTDTVACDSKTIEIRQRFILPVPVAPAAPMANVIQHEFNDTTTGSTDHDPQVKDAYHQQQQTLLHRPAIPDINACSHAAVSNHSQQCVDNTTSVSFRQLINVPIGTIECYAPLSDVLSTTMTPTAEHISNSLPPLDNKNSISHNIADYNYSVSLLCGSTTTLDFGHSSEALPLQEAFSPVTECNYCKPEYGFHQASCLTYVSFMNLQK